MENKKEFTQMIEALLRADCRSDVVVCEYTKEGHNEIVTIIFKGGYAAKINVNCNSLGAILKEVVREVYGDGAFGTYFHGWIDDGEEAAEWTRSDRRRLYWIGCRHAEI